eukprot:tig00021179_g19229.t1
MCRGSYFQPAPFFLRAFAAQSPIGDEVKDTPAPSPVLPKDFFSPPPLGGPPREKKCLSEEIPELVLPAAAVPVVGPTFEKSGKRPEPAAALSLSLSLSLEVPAPEMRDDRKPSLLISVLSPVPSRSDVEGDAQSAAAGAKDSDPGAEAGRAGGRERRGAGGLTIALDAAPSRKRARSVEATPRSAAGTPRSCDVVREPGYPFPTTRRRAQPFGSDSDSESGGGGGGGAGPSLPLPRPAPRPRPGGAPPSLCASPPPLAAIWCSPGPPGSGAWGFSPLGRAPSPALPGRARYPMECAD